MWCIGYIGYNFFRGTEDPDWNTIEEKFQTKIAKLEQRDAEEKAEREKVED